MRCEFSPQAVADLQEIGDFISRDNPERARSFVLELLDHAHRLAGAWPRTPLLRSPALRHFLFNESRSGKDRANHPRIT